MAEDKTITMGLDDAKPSIEDRAKAKPTILDQLRTEIEKKVERPTIEIVNCPVALSQTRTASDSTAPAQINEISESVTTLPVPPISTILPVISIG